ncbi:hypothetical protein GCM10007916_08180 [Psychromonas marina]|uniref:DUF1513 domain-containing protein n=1 Tax=Psychromonas marina TaxID=88364 RepID=A0ABQ6DX62_9GAMM|nr:DUF1513 domain-containing protein [Psychromonas marina]GLS89751.1 hypothetical protein GCM10007916_08180 [Psychromonas marina]
MSRTMLRRDFLRLSGQLLLAGIIPTNSYANNNPSLSNPSQAIIYGCAKKQDQYYLVGCDLQGNTLNHFALPSRGHGIAIDNTHQQAVVFARRPDNYFIQFNPLTGSVINEYQIESGEHFLGHGCFDQQGLLYVCEADTDSSQTSIAVYQLNDKIKKIAEFSGFGLGGHEIVMHPDNQHLILALGGIKTRGREKINLDTMQPALLYIDKMTGEVKQTLTLDDHLLSIRHLAVNQDGLVVFACQYQSIDNQSIEAQYPENQGLATQSLDELPALIYHHQLGKRQVSPLIANEETWLRFDDYIGSIAISEQKIVATSPRGNCYAVWDISDKKLQKIKPLTDVCGASFYQQKVALTTGNGEQGIVNNMQLTQWHWDNHMAIWLG